MLVKHKKTPAALARNAAGDLLYPKHPKKQFCLTGTFFISFSPLQPSEQNPYI